MTNKIYFFLAVLCFSFPFAGKSQKANHSFTHWSGLEIASPYLNNGNSSELKGDHDLKTDENKSIGIRFNLLEKKWGNTASGTGFLTGLSLGMDSYDWKKNIELKTNGDLSMNQLQIIENSTENFKSNQLNVFKLSIPLLLEINFSKNQKKHLHLSTGVLANWHISQDQYFQYTNEKGRIQNYRKDDVGVKRFSLEHTVRFGFGKFTFFMTQGITPFFEETSVQNIYNASIGFSLIPFDSKSGDEKKKYNIKDHWKI